MAIITAVTKDKAGVRMILPVAEELRKRGHEISVWAEGLSAAIWKKAGWELQEEGPVDATRPVPLCPGFRADAILAGLSFPNHWEDECSSFANKHAIPIHWFEDTWGAHTRSKAVPTTIFVIDDIAKEIIAQEERFRTSTEVVVCGDPAMGEFAGVEERKASRFRTLQNQRISILFSGQGEHTTEMLQFLLLSVADDREPVMIIPRFHPKYASKPFAATWAIQLELFAAFRKDMLEDPADFTTDELASLCDITVSCFGTSLRIAAQCARVPVSIKGPMAQRAMVENSGLYTYPLVTVGAAIQTLGRFSISDALARREELREAQKRYLNAPVFNPARCADVIERL